MVYKTNESIIVIQAEAINPIQTNVVFWSHDRGTAKLRMKLVRKNGVPQSLPEGTTVPIRLMFKSATAEGGYGKHDYLATVEDPVNGIVSIVLEDNILGYVGTVEGSVYIDFPNDRSLDTAGRFTFDIKRSPIDDSTPELEDYYFNGFSQTIDKVEKILADGKQEIDEKVAESETQIDAKLKDTNDKITKANQDVATLNTNIEAQKEKFDAVSIYNKAEVDSKVADLDSVKADKTFVDAQLAQKATKEELKNMGSASPKGTYATLSALQTAYPNGTTGIYVVTGDGKWYFWNGSAWTAGGQYQSTGIADKSITPKKIEFMQTGINKFDKTSIKSGQYVSYLDGSLLTNANYGWVEIPVSGGRIYARNNINQHFAWYDANGVFIPNPNAPQVTTAITAPANATILRMSVLLTNLNTQMLVEGSIVPDYEPYRQFIPALYLDQKPLETDLVERLINVPSKIHALTGMSNNMYYENIMNKALNKDIDVVSTKGFQFDVRYAYTPSVAEVVPLKFSFYEKGKLVNSKSTSLEIKTPSDITSNFKAVFIGDSNTNAGVYTQKILDLFSTDVSKITLVGTRGNAPNLHEGRSGWSASTYTSNASLSGIANAFWNPSTSKFDFAYWASQNSITGLTHTFIALGTNDIFNFATDTELRSGVVTVLNQFDEMVSSVKSHSGTIKIGIMLPIPPSGKQNDFASAYGAGITRWRYKRNYDYFVSELIKRFDNKTSDNIHLVSSNLSIDPDNDFINSNSTPAVHPNTTGYNKMGEQVYKFLKVVG